MFKVAIQKDAFKALLAGTVHATAKDDSRPILKYIKLEISKETIVATSLDGYMAGRVRIKQKNEQEFTCFIKPLPIKEADAMIPIIVEYNDENGIASVTVPTNGSIITYSFKQPSGDFPNMEEIFDNALKHDEETSCNAQYLLNACRAICSHGFDRNRLVTILTSQNQVKPFVLRAGGDDILDERLILPVRV